MNNQKLSTAEYTKLINFIWQVADDCLRDVFVRGKYRDIILPMTVIRRFDCVIEPKKKEMLELKDLFEKNNTTNLEKSMESAVDLPIYNISKFTLKDLKNETNTQNLKKNFEEYLDGFSANVREILDKFKFRNQLETMSETGILGSVIEKFVSSDINLSPYPVLNQDKEILKPALDNHTMGVLFEELIRKFNEENNEEAGEHFTPRDVIELMADIAVIPVKDKIKDAPYTLYDGAAGTLGMCTVAVERLEKIAKDKNKNITTHIYGQEINPETYAIAKADMLLKGQGRNADNIFFGSTISNDQLPENKFDFMLSNPPYGKNWKTDLEKIGQGSDKDLKKNVIDTRFAKNYKNEPDFRMIPDVSDGQLLFLLNNISKMKPSSEIGSRIVEVHNGSALFTGSVGNGANNARKYMIENDLLEAIIELPENIFYNTGISTYLWILSNKKEDIRKGKIQLINASQIKTTLRKNMGKKNCELSKENQDEILNLYLNFKENEKSKIFNNEEFGYFSVVVERPLRLKITINDENLAKFENIIKKIGILDDNFDKKFLKEFNELKSTKSAIDEFSNTKKIKFYFEILKSFKKDEDYLSYANFEKEFNKKAKSLPNATLNNLSKTGLFDLFVSKDENAEALKDQKGNFIADTDLRDNEQIPLNYDGGIENFMQKEVLPYHSDAWIDENSIKIGYEINFTKYFYVPKKLPSLKEIITEIKRLEEESKALMDSILEDLDCEI